MKKIENNYAFIDSNNLHLAIKSCDWDLDFTRFYIYLKDKYRISKAFLFIGYFPGNETLYTYLQKTGYIIIFNYLEKKLGKLPKIKRGVAYKTSS